MRKSLIMGTKEDVINLKKAKLEKGDLLGLPIERTVYPSVTVPARRIVTFNHPILGNN